MSLREIAIRITADNDLALTSFAEQWPTSVWCKEEPDLEKHCNRIHYHGYITSSYSNNGLRKQIYNYFEIPKEKQGNQTLAFTKIDEKEGYFRYINKGTSKTYPNIVYDNIDLDMEHYYTEYWKTNQEIMDKLKEKKNLKKTAKQNFKDYFINEVLPTKNRVGKAQLKIKQICMLMYHWYKDNDKELPSKSQGQIILNDLYLRYTAQDDKVEFKVLEYYGLEWE